MGAQIAELQKNQKNNFKNALAAGLCFTAAKPVKKVTGKIISKFANKLKNKIEFSSHFIIYLAPRNAKEIFNKFISASIIIFKAAQNTEYYLLKNIEKAVK